MWSAFRPEKLDGVLSVTASTKPISSGVTRASIRDVERLLRRARFREKALNDEERGKRAKT